MEIGKLESFYIIYDITGQPIQQNTITFCFEEDLVYQHEVLSEALKVNLIPEGYWERCELTSKFPDVPNDAKILILAYDESLHSGYETKITRILRNYDIEILRYLYKIHSPIDLKPTGKPIEIITYPWFPQTPIGSALPVELIVKSPFQLNDTRNLYLPFREGNKERFWRIQNDLSK